MLFIEPYRTPQGLSPAMSNAMGQIIAALLANSPNRQAGREAQGELYKAQALKARNDAELSALKVFQESQKINDDTDYRAADAALQRARANPDNAAMPGLDVFNRAMAEGLYGGRPVPLDVQARLAPLANMTGGLGLTEAQKRNIFTALNPDKVIPDSTAFGQDEILRREAAKRQQAESIARIAADASRSRAPAPAAPNLSQAQAAQYTATVNDLMQQGRTREEAAKIASGIFGGAGGGGGASTVSRELSTMIKDSESLISGMEAALDMDQLSQLPPGQAPITGTFSGLRETGARAVDTALRAFGGSGFQSETLANTAKLRNSAQYLATLVVGPLAPVSNADMLAAARAVGDGSATPDQLRALSSHVLSIGLGRVRQEREAAEAALDDPRVTPAARARAQEFANRLRALETRIGQGAAAAVGVRAPVAGQTVPPSPGAQRVPAPPAASNIPRYNPATGEFE